LQADTAKPSIKLLVAPALHFLIDGTPRSSDGHVQSPI